MRTVRSALPPLVVSIVGACAGAPPAVQALPDLRSAAITIRSVAAAALDADHRRDIIGDTLWVANAIAVADAQRRESTPRFAAVGDGGVLDVGDVQVSVLGEALGWVIVDYRWQSNDGLVERMASATMLIRRGSDGWRIFHAHSSQILPWQ